jgi:hypothetical protein
VYSLLKKEFQVAYPLACHGEFFYHPHLWQHTRKNMFKMTLPKNMIEKISTPLPRNAFAPYSLIAQEVQFQVPQKNSNLSHWKELQKKMFLVAPLVQLNQAVTPRLLLRKVRGRIKLSTTVPSFRRCTLLSWQKLQNLQVLRDNNKRREGAKSTSLTNAQYQSSRENKMSVQTHASLNS